MKSPLPALLACGLLWAVTLSGCEQFQSPTAVRRLKMAHVYELRAPTHLYGTSRLAARLRESGIDLDITVFPAAQLGSEEELLEQLVAGELDLAISGPSFLGMWHPPLAVLDAAYAFHDLDQMLDVARSDVMAEHWEQLRLKYGVRVLDTWAYGSRHLTSNRPVRSAEDLRGFRLRLPSTRVYQASGEALGASPMPVAFGEVYLALQQGIADGQENPIPVIRAMGFHEVQKYLTLTGHIQSSVQVLINDRIWQELTPEQQQGLVSAVRELGEDVYQRTIAEERELLEEWQQTKTLSVVHDVDLESFRRRSRDYFSSGFPFSELYLEITSSAAAPSARSPERESP